MRLGMLATLVLTLGCAFGGQGCSTLHAIARDAAAAAVAEARPALEAAADKARADALERAERLARDAGAEAKALAERAGQEARAFAEGLAREAAEKGKAVAVDAGAAATGAVVARLEDRVAELQARKGTEDEGPLDGIQVEVLGGAGALALLVNKWLNQRKEERLLLTPPPSAGPLMKPTGTTTT